MTTIQTSAKLQDTISAQGYAYVRLGSDAYHRARKLEAVGAVVVSHYSGGVWVVRKVRTK